MMTSSTPSDASKQASLAAAIRQELERRSKERRLSSYQPYPKQLQFHANGKTSLERLLMAANQVGKTLSASAETAMHATGLYPDWWPGYRFTRATVGWASGITGLSTRDNPQRLLMGRPGEAGTGMIPKATIKDVRNAPHGVADAIDHVKVQHTSGDTSIIYFKSYEQGRQKWQGETLDWLWYDEEPPEDIYSEGLVRLQANAGLAYMTFTPLLGMSAVVRRFLIDKPQGTSVTTMTIDDALHYTPERRAQIVAGYLPHEREARSKGIPTLGSGRVFPVTEEEIAETAIAIPDTWPRLCAIDFGWNHPFAAVWVAWDRDTDTMHVYDCYRIREQTPSQHAIVLRGKGVWIPVAWPHDGLQMKPGPGEAKQLQQLYKDAGVEMLPGHATHADGKGYATEPGITGLLERMHSGRFKVAKHLNDWWEEFRLYHRKDGLIVKENDDLMSATRIAFMALRYSKTKPKPVLPEGGIFGGSPMGWMR